jgi:hypothetical protein
VLVVIYFPFLYYPSSRYVPRTDFPLKRAKGALA